MALLTIDEIVDKKFDIVPDGYDKNEVNLFLDKICDELDHLQQYNDYLCREMENGTSTKIATSPIPVVSLDDIIGKVFSTSENGYAQESVNAFMESAAETINHKKMENAKIRRMILTAAPKNNSSEPEVTEEDINREQEEKLSTDSVYGRVSEQNVKQKHEKKKIWIIPVAIAVVLLVAGYFVYSNVIKPNQVMDEAQNLIDRGKYSEAEIKLASISSSTRKTEMLTSISLSEAKEALKAGNYELAESKLALIPEYAITNDVRLELNTQKASVFIGQGRFIEADALYAELEQTEDIIAIRKQLFIDSSSP